MPTLYFHCSNDILEPTRFQLLLWPRRGRYLDLSLSHVMDGGVSLISTNTYQFIQPARYIFPFSADNLSHTSGTLVPPFQTKQS